MKSKELIVDAYKRLVINKKTSKITVKELCSELHISRTTFYKYFKDTYEILEHILITDGICTIDPLIDARINRFSIVEGWYMTFYKNRSFYYYAIQDESQNSLFNTLIKVLSEYNKNLYITQKKEFSFQDIDYYSYKYASSQAMLLKKWICEGMKIEPKKMAEYFINDLLNEHIE